MDATLSVVPLFLTSHAPFLDAGYPKEEEDEDYSGDDLIDPEDDLEEPADDLEEPVDDLVEPADMDEVGEGVTADPEMADADMIADLEEADAGVTAEQEAAEAEDSYYSRFLRLSHRKGRNGDHTGSD